MERDERDLRGTFASFSSALRWMRARLSASEAALPHSSFLGHPLDGIEAEEVAEEEDAMMDSADDGDRPSEEDSELLEELPSVLPRPAPCSFLAPGRTFSGTQRLSGLQRQQEDWAVTATLYSCCMASGRLAGSLVAQNNPSAKRPVVTYFEGEIIDNVNHTFYTGRKWGACPSRDTDLRHWARCPGFGAALRCSVAAHEGRAAQLGSCPFIFMRWKECFFVDVPQDCPLSITGFYYMSLERATGAIRGFYHDTRSAPMQVLQLHPSEVAGGAAGPGAAVALGPPAVAPGPHRASLSGAAGGPQQQGAPGGQGQGAQQHEAAPGGPPTGVSFGTYAFC